MRARGISINGRLTGMMNSHASYEDVKPLISENSANNSWNLNFSNGNLYYNYKYGSYYVRPCTAFDFLL